MMIDEGYTKFLVDWQRSEALDLPQIDELNEWRRPLFDAGLIGVYEDLGIGFGNISMRVGGDGKFVISGTQTGHLDELGGEHYSLVTGYSLEHNHVTCRGPVQASSESMTHAAIYELDPAIQAIAHVHCEELWVGLMDTMPTTDASVAYGTPDMAKEFVRLYRECDFAKTGIAVMAGHESGLISVGSSMKEAAMRLLAIDRDALQTRENP